MSNLELFAVILVYLTSRSGLHVRLIREPMPPPHTEPGRPALNWLIEGATVIVKVSRRWEVCARIGCFSNKSIDELEI